MTRMKPGTSALPSASYDRRLDRLHHPPVIDSDQPDFISVAGHGERRTDVAAVKHRHGILVADKGNDRVVAAQQGHTAQLHDEVVLVPAGQRRGTIPGRNHRKTRENISAPVDTYDEA